MRRFQHFRLHVEFRYSRGQDSGIFLRGRYEVQIRNNSDRGWPDKSTTGAVYGFLIPAENAAPGPDQWQAMDIPLVGRRVTVVLNGRTVIADGIIPGVTGSAVDSDEAVPGPIMLQGEEKRVEFRNIEPQAAFERPASRCANRHGQTAMIACGCGRADGAVPARGADRVESVFALRPD